MPFDANGNWVQGPGIQPQNYNNSGSGYVPPPLVPVPGEPYLSTDPNEQDTGYSTPGQGINEGAQPGAGGQGGYGPPSATGNSYAPYPYQFNPNQPGGGSYGPPQGGQGGGGGQFTGAPTLENLTEYYRQQNPADGDPEYWARQSLEKINKGADVQGTLSYMTARGDFKQLGGSGGGMSSGGYGSNYQAMPMFGGIGQAQATTYNAPQFNGNTSVTPYQDFNYSGPQAQQPREFSFPGVTGQSQSSTWNGQGQPGVRQEQGPQARDAQGNPIDQGGTNIPRFDGSGQPLPEGFTPGTFTAPTAEQGLTDDPGYQFRLRQQQDALLQNRAAFGTLMNTGTAQSLMDLSGQLASQEYGNVYNRRFGEFGQSEQERLAAAQQAQSLQAQGYGQAANTFGVNQAAQNQAFGQSLAGYQANTGAQAEAQNRAFNQQYQGWSGNQANSFNAQNASVGNALNAFGQNAQAGLGAAQLNNQSAQQAWQNNYGQALDAYNSAVQQNQFGASLGLSYDQLGQNASQFNQNFGLAQNNQNYNQNLQTYQTNYGTYRNNQNDNFNRDYSLATLGQNSANSAGQYGTNYGNQASEIYTGQGNANAAGQVGSTNAWNNFYTSLPNNFANYYGYYQGQQPNRANTPGYGTA